MAPTLDQANRTHRTARQPATDEDTAAAARLMAEAVQFLNHATAGGAGLSYPATAYTVTGELASAAARLGQLTGRSAGSWPVSWPPGGWAMTSAVTRRTP